MSPLHPKMEGIPNPRTSRFSPGTGWITVDAVVISRWILFAACGAAGLLLAAGGLLIPAHLRAVDGTVLEIAGRKTTGLIDDGLQTKSPGIARLLLEAARKEAIPGQEKLAARVSALPPEEPSAVGRIRTGSGPFTEFLVQTETREQLLEFLDGSKRPEVQALLRFRAMTNTAVFAPSESSAGQPLDISIAIAGLLIEDDRVTPGLSAEFYRLAIDAEHGGGSQEIEQALLDLLSLGQRFNYSQLQAFIGGIRDVATLGKATTLVRAAGDRLPVLFAAVQLSGNPAGVAAYLAQYNETGLGDIAASLRYGAGGVNELLRRKERLHASSLRPALAGELCLLRPHVALAVKCLLYLAGGFLLAAAWHYARRVPALERPLQVRGFHVAREGLFAVGFLAVVLLLSEPFLAQESQKVQLQPFTFGLPTVNRSITRPGLATPRPTFMNQNLLTLLVFLVLQALVYIACRVKLAEIRRQAVAARLKLRLLENEEHLFDAGLYLGFFGTVLSMILVSLGMVKFSLMAAYGSTAFGIVFVMVFKIFSLRPLRRRLLLESESMPPVPTDPVPPVGQTETQPS